MKIIFCVNLFKNNCLEIFNIIKQIINYFGSQFNKINKQTK